jgi:hypothetical protein
METRLPQDPIRSRFEVDFEPVVMVNLGLVAGLYFLRKALLAYHEQLPVPAEGATWRRKRFMVVHHT